MNFARPLSTSHYLARALRRIPVTQRGALFIFCGLLFVFLTFGGLSLFSVHKVMQRITKSLTGCVQITAQRLAEHVAHLRSGVEHLAEWPGIALNIDQLQSDRPGISPPWVTLHYLSSDTHDFGDCVFVTGRTGNVMWTKPPGLGLLGRNVSAYPGLRAVATQDATYTSGLIQDGFWREPHVLVAAPLRNDRHEIIGAVGDIVSAARLKSGELFNELRGLTAEVASLETYLVDADGGVITGTDPSRIFTRITDEPLLSRLRQRVPTFTSIHDDRIQVTEPIAGTSWSLVLEHSARILYKDASELQRNLLWVGLLLMLAALLVWIPFIESFVSPIRNLTAEAQRIASGDLDNQISHDGSDELADLSAAFDHMRRQIQNQQLLLQEQIDELQEMNRLKNEFIANLSHEFRTPVHIMRGYTDLILDGAFGDVPADLMEPLTAVSRQYASLWSLLESCLDIAKIDAGEVQLETQGFDICALVGEVMEEFKPLLAANELRAVVTFPDCCRRTLPNVVPNCQVRGDRHKTQRILRNLMSNALKFTAQGEIEIAAEIVPGSDTFTLRVRDTGIGIREEDQAIIFDRFRQVDGSNTRRYGGVGLGLHIVAELVGLLKGSISVSSTVGVGTTFTVVLPRVIEAAQGFRSAVSDSLRPSPPNTRCSAEAAELVEVNPFGGGEARSRVGYAG